MPVHVYRHLLRNLRQYVVSLKLFTLLIVLHVAPYFVVISNIGWIDIMLVLVYRHLVRNLRPYVVYRKLFVHSAYRVARNIVFRANIKYRVNQYNAISRTSSLSSESPDWLCVWHKQFTLLVAWHVTSYFVLLWNRVNQYNSSSRTS